MLSGSGENDALFSRKKGFTSSRGGSVKQKGKIRASSYNCYSCGLPGHLARNCENREMSGSYEEAKQRNPFIQNARFADQSNEFTFMVNQSQGTTEEKWYVDSGCTQHMCCVKEYFCDYTALEVQENVRLANNSVVQGIGIGTIRWSNPKLNVNFRIEDVLYVPDLGQNLISVHRIAQKGIDIIFTEDLCEFRKAENQKLCSTARVKKGCSQYELDGFVVKSENAAIAENILNLDLWHQQLGHVSKDTLKNMFCKGVIEGLHLEKDCKIKLCESCIAGKQTREKFPKDGGTRATELLEIVHSDVCGPMPVRSLGGNKYFVTFIDDFSRYGAVYFIKEKNQVLPCFKEYVSMVKRQTEKKVKVLRSDNGTEYVNKDFDLFLKRTGIERQLIVPYTPEQNGVPERKNRTLMESARSLMHFANSTQEFWAEAVLTSMYIQNRCTTKAVEGVVPFEAFFGKKPSVKDFKVFGCDAYVHIPKEKRQKLDAKSTRHIFLGYSGTQKGYRLYDPKSKKVTISRDVKFDESSFGGCSKNALINAVKNNPEIVSKNLENDMKQSKNNEDNSDASHDDDDDDYDDDDDDDDDAEDDAADPERIEPRKSVRERKAPSMYGDWVEGEE